MASTTYTAAQVAREASAIMRRPVTDKAVRGLARTMLGTHDKTAHPEYQRHAYTGAERTRLLNVYRARAKGAGARPASKPKTTRRVKPAAAPSAEA